MRPIVTVAGVSKRYRIGASRVPYSTLRESLVGALRRVGRRGGRPAHETVWALRDVSFEIRPGEVVGIIGRNGAGKSTLLKILSRITEPTTGEIKLFGRVGSLLEVGTGFHAELTGRENVFLNGAILGMARAEIASKFDEIVEFSGVGRYLDTPVKHYSSGMYMRLAFSVAAHLEPEILVVDEVLAVGDAGFQKKCLGKMEDVATQGRTVLFVSHNMAAVQSLCRRAVWLRGGEVVDDGQAGAVVGKYLKDAANVVVETTWPDMAGAPGNDRARLRSVRVVPGGDATADAMSVATPFDLEVEYWNLKPDARLNLSVFVTNEEGTLVFNAVSVGEANWDGKLFPAGLYRSRCRVPGNLLNDGLFRVSLLIVEDTTSVVYRHDEAVAFEIHDDMEGRGDWYGRWSGVVRPKLEWSTSRIDSEPAEPVTSADLRPGAAAR